MTKALCPLDGSQRSRDAAVRGLALLPKGTDVVLFCVQNAGFDRVADDRVEMFDEDEDDEVFPTKESAQRMLDEVAEACSGTGCRVTTKVAKGPVRKQIVKEAKKGGYDVMVMHELDRSGFKEKFKMSGTEWLARNVPCSVLLVAD